MAAKRLEMLHAFVPTATLIAYLVDPTNPAISEREPKLAQAAAHALGVRLLTLSASTPSGIEAAFESLIHQQVGGLLVGNHPLFGSQRDQIVALAAAHRVPAIYNGKEDVAAGGLMSYGASLADAYRQVATYVGRILRGEKPADLPVQQSVKIELTINLKTAMAHSRNAAGHRRRGDPVMRRREFIAGLGSAAAWPVVARAQQPGLPVIGYLSPSTPGERASDLPQFSKGLSEMGFVDGRNVAIEYHWGQNDARRLSELAADLVRRQVAVIAAVTGPSARAAKALTSTIPIVFTSAFDPVEGGLVASLNRPGGNVTGVVALTDEIGGKRLGLLHELLPRATRFAVLGPPIQRTFIPDLQAAAQSIG
jgi:ABC-type uncharacterized transport system substrate-binding protein